MIHITIGILAVGLWSLTWWAAQAWGGRKVLLSLGYSEEAARRKVEAVFGRRPWWGENDGAKK